MKAPSRAAGSQPIPVRLRLKKTPSIHAAADEWRVGNRQQAMEDLGCWGNTTCSKCPFIFMPFIEIATARRVLC